METSTQLLHWDGKHAQIAPKLELNGTVYEPAEFEVTFLRAIRLPNYRLEYGSRALLTSELATTIQKYSGLSSDSSRLIAYYVFMTWLSDLMPMAPRLSLIGLPTTGGYQLMRLLSCVCRHAVRLTAVSSSTFFSLPPDFGLTILIRQAKVSSELREILDAATSPGQFVPRSKQLLEPFSPVILHTDKPVRNTSGAAEIEIPLTLDREDLPLLDAAMEASISNKFQNQLLAFRLENFAKVDQSKFDPRGLCFPVREISRTLGSCFPADPDLQADVVSLLKGRDTVDRVQRSVSLEALLLESLLFRCHEAQGDHAAGVYAGDLASDIRAISKGRGEQINIKPRAVGELLRSLGFKPDRLDRYGRGILLCEAVVDRAHELAGTFQVPTMSQGARACARCIDLGKLPAIAGLGS